MGPRFRLTRGRLLEAAFVERPNRFLVVCRLANGRRVDAFLPNPGRLHELLLPGARMWVRENAAPAIASPAPARTLFTALAVERDGRPICLDTHITARVAGHLIERGLVAQLKGSRVLRYEVAAGHSRFDMLVERKGEQILTEVKSVTLYGNGVAMFPDAVTERGRRHFTELAALSREGRRAMVIFIVHTPDVRWFMPDYHTDFEFARTMLAARRDLEIFPLAVAWRPDLSLAEEVRVLDVPWDYLEREVQDRGVYLLVMRLDHPRAVETGSLGSITFKPGYYVYVGSAMANLGARIGRHLRRRKTMHWHIDYLRDVADTVKALPVRTSQRVEEPLASTLAAVLMPGPPGFGASDSSQATHLFYSVSDPMQDRRFHDALMAYRMRAPV
ncbi:MAG: DNA/RNA nuclease SfsA [Chloroflexi bacterium]|nr:DNA/RNA nuclease SfsA [Chloroflexota bacterium]